MKANVEQLVRQGAVALAFDTNALSGYKRFFGLCDVVKRLNGPPWQLGFKVVVPAVAHGEHVLHIRHRKGRDFDSAKIWTGLEDKGVEIRTFDAHDAESVSELIARRYPDDSSWQQAKRDLAIRRLGLSAAQAAGVKGQTFDHTVDWLISGQAANNGWILVTNDKDLAFADVPLKIDLDSLEGILKDLIAARSSTARQ